MERKKRRSHEEVLAAREAYLKEREAKKAKREKLIAEKVARKNMTPEEKSENRRQRLKERIQNFGAVVPTIGQKFSPYSGKISVGDRVIARFAGSFISGIVTDIEFAEDPEIIGNRGYDMYTILVEGKGPYGGMKCPAQKKNIIAKIK